MSKTLKRVLTKISSLCLAGVMTAASLTAFAGEQLGQNTFSDGVGIPWHVCESGPAKLDFNIDGGSYNVTILNPGGAARGGESRWDCQLRHRGITIVAGHNYTVKFEVTASNSGQLYTKIGDLSGKYEVWHNGNDDSNFSNCWNTINLTANQKYTCNTSFTAQADLMVPGVTEMVSEWAFHFGGAGEWQATDCFPVGTVLKFDNLYLIDNTSSKFDYVHEAKYIRNEILVNQLGYYPALTKEATLVVDENDMTAKDFELVNASGKTVYTGKTTPVGFDADSGDWVHKINFTEYTTQGENFVLKCGSKKSYPFSISNGVYDGVLTNAVNYYYQNRSGVPIEAEYITSGDKSSLAHQAGHTTDTAYIQSKWVKSYLSDGSDVERGKTQDVTGGWYDAGDHGKYVVNGGISVWTLNNIYERALANGDASKWDDNSGTVVIPENGNKIPDILDETRYELDWMFSMLVKDGEYKNMVYHKMHDHKWTGLAVRPWDYESEWKTVRIIKPPTTAATLNFVACAAQSYRLWKDFDADFADKCLKQAKASYAAAKANPEMYAPLDQAIGGGAYGDDNVKDDFYWAACELYASTGDAEYYNDLKAYDKAFEMQYDLSGGENSGSRTSFNWGNTAGLGNITLFLNSSKITSDELSKVENSIKKSADVYVGLENKQGYGIPYEGTTFTDAVNLGEGVEVEGYEWGSNSMVVNNAIVMAYAYDITEDVKYADGVSNAMNYIYGRNALEYSYVTGYGEHATANPHHRYWSHQLDAEFPMAPSGVLSGGANSGMQDPYIKGAGYKRGEVAPQLCYVDNIESWASNEVTINWNAPFAWVTSWMEDVVPTIEYTERPEDTDTSTDTDTDTNTNTDTDTDTSTDTDTNTNTDTDTDTSTDIDGYEKGDINADGAVDILDVVLARAHIVGNSQLAEDQIARGDMDEDKSLAILDVVLIRNKIVNG